MIGPLVTKLPLIDDTCSIAGSNNMHIGPRKTRPDWAVWVQLNPCKHRGQFNEMRVMLGTSRGKLGR